MNSVWILQYCIEYEGCSIEAIFDECPSFQDIVDLNTTGLSDKKILQLVNNKYVDLESGTSYELREQKLIKTKGF